MRKITRIILHCSASPNLKELSVEDIRKEHMMVRKFSDIGYHFVIEPNGLICGGRPIEREGAHCEGENFDSIGVCLIGLDRFTAEQFTSLRVLFNSLLGRYQIPIDKIYCHYEFSSAKKQGKTCPNISHEDLISWYSSTDVTSISKYLLDL
jgi:N-acetyl-anhydromuramyl-L-alanine amidase AmpD